MTQHEMRFAAWLERMRVEAVTWALDNGGVQDIIVTITLRNGFSNPLVTLGVATCYARYWRQGSVNWVPGDGFLGHIALPPDKVRMVAKLLNDLVLPGAKEEQILAQKLNIPECFRLKLKDSRAYGPRS